MEIIFDFFYAQTTSAEPPSTSSTVSKTVGEIPADSEHLVLGEGSPGYTAEGEIISTQTVSSKTRTVETITVRKETQSELAKRTKCIIVWKRVFQ